jgi:hypothetical protein
MASNSPLLTLVAGGLLGAGLLVASSLATPDEPGSDASADATEVAADATEVAADVTTEPAPGYDEPTAQGGASPTPEPEPSPDQTTPPDAEPRTYVGRVDSGGASVALIVSGNEAIAYVCDGVSVEAWLSGAVAGERVELANDGGATLTATYDDTGAAGEVSASGRASWTFVIEAVDPPEGLYRFADTVVGGAEVVGGWIVLPDGTQVGVVNVDGRREPAEEIDLATGEVEIDGVAVTPRRLTGEDLD